MWTKSLQADVLQCIVASLLVIHALIMIVRKKERFPWAAGVVALGISLSTPWMWAHDFTKTLPLSLAMYLNPHEFSLFPIFPWMCFVLIGSIASCLFLKAADAGQINQFMKKSVVIGIGLILAGYLFCWFPFTLPGKVHFYRTSPLFLMIRIGCVLLICSLLYVLEIKKIQVPKLLQLAGRESLLIYGVHLVLIFNVLRGKQLGPILGLQLGYPGCFALSAAIIILMLYLAKGWNRLKRWNLRFAKRFQVAAVVGMTIFFFLN
jgi:fucose 4-O-acetylase-like acetyltransferase